MTEQRGRRAAVAAGAVLAAAVARGAVLYGGTCTGATALLPGTAGAVIAVPPITFGGSDTSVTMPDWSGAGTGFAFVKPDGIWRASGAGWTRDFLGPGSQPDWR